MYVVTCGAVARGRADAVRAARRASPRRARCVRCGSWRGRRPAEPPAGYVGWPLWYHRVCLVHNRAFGWLFIAGLALGAVWPHVPA